MWDTSTQSLVPGLYEALTGHKPNVSHFRVIGSTAFILIPKEKRGDKLQATNSRAILIGYDEQSKAYRLYDPISKQIVVSHHVHFLEHQLGNFHTPDSSFTDVFAPLFDSSGDLALTTPPRDPIAVHPAHDFGPAPRVAVDIGPEPIIADLPQQLELDPAEEPPADNTLIPAAPAEIPGPLLPRRYPTRD